MAERTRIVPRGCFLIFPTFLILVIIDQISKYAFRSDATQGHPPISLLTSSSLTFIVAVATIAGLVLTLRLTKRKAGNTPKNNLLTTKIGIITILAGGISNLIDLITKEFATDIFNIAGLHFNIADVYIIAGSLLILTVTFRKNHASNRWI